MKTPWQAGRSPSARRRHRPGCVRRRVARRAGPARASAGAFRAPPAAAATHRNRRPTRRCACSRCRRDESPQASASPAASRTGTARAGTPRCDPPATSRWTRPWASPGCARPAECASPAGCRRRVESPGLRGTSARSGADPTTDSAIWFRRGTKGAVALLMPRGPALTRSGREPRRPSRATSLCCAPARSAGPRRPARKHRPR